MALTDKIYKGQYILFNNDPHLIIDKEFVAPGKGSAFTRVKMRNLTNGKIISFTFRSGEKVDEIEVNILDHQYLYKDGNTYYFMNNKTYEQVTLSADVIGDFTKLMKEGETYMIVVYKDEPIGLNAPLKVVRQVIETQVAVKGNTVTNATKKATTEGDYELQVPLFIKKGEYVAINTETGKYVERAPDPNK